MKTADLIGPQLDWAVAKCEGFTDYDPLTEKIMPPRKEYGWVAMYELNYSTDWSQGGPIIEREKLLICAWVKANGKQKATGTRVLKLSCTSLCLVISAPPL